MARWYAVQVECGREAATAQQILSTLGGPQGAVRECFSPLWQTQEKRRGTWQFVERRLIPGYVIAVSNQPKQLEEGLYRVPGMSRMLRSEGGFVPLADSEVGWIDRHALGERRVVPMSRAVKEGDRVTVTAGPLMDRTLRVARIDRHRSTAYVEVKFLGRRKLVPMGLAVLSAE